MYYWPLTAAAVLLAAAYVWARRQSREDPAILLWVALAGLVGAVIVIVVAFSLAL